MVNGLRTNVLKHLYVSMGGVVPQAYNFRLNGANYFIVAPEHDIVKRNISWKFGEPPTSWRHIIARDVNLRRHFPRKMTSRAIKWRHCVGFSPKVQEMFLVIISCCGANIKWFPPFKRKLLTVYISILNAYVYIVRHRKYKIVQNFRLNGANDFIFIPQLQFMNTNISWNFGENST